MNFLRLAVLSCVALATLPAAPISVTWDSGAGANGHTYTLYDIAVSWTTANAAATAAGGYLASITSAEEQAFLNTHFVNYAYWIGFSDAATEGVFAWTSGETVNYTNWNAGEPNNVGNEDYTQTLGGVGLWNDLPGTSTNYFVVEQDSAVPEPSTMLMLGSGVAAAAVAMRRRKA